MSAERLFKRKQERMGLTVRVRGKMHASTPKRYYEMLDEFYLEEQMFQGQPHVYYVKWSPTEEGKLFHRYISLRCEEKQLANKERKIRRSLESGK